MRLLYQEKLVVEESFAFAEKYFCEEFRYGGVNAKPLQ
jgi:hypothetical protein